jgi:hypothetical protein
MAKIGVPSKPLPSITLELRDLEKLLAGETVKLDYPYVLIRLDPEARRSLLQSRRDQAAHWWEHLRTG